MPESRRICGSLLLLAVASLAAAVASAAHPEIDICSPPISVCNVGPIILDGTDASRPDIFPPPPLCPEGYTCTCVPSCPECDDCAAEVCVRSGDRDCRTACDCPSGLGCFDGRCIAGFAPVYCCDAGPCPQGQQCQHSDGNMDFCGDPMCEERLAKVHKRVKKWVKRKNRCETADDCVHIDTSTDCRGTCGAFVNQTKREKVAAKIARADKKFCDGYIGDGCPYATPSCAYQEPVCVDGRCTGAPFAVAE
jgi:hypothetical protein